MRMKRGRALSRVLIADNTPMIAAGLQLLLDESALSVLVGIASCKIELMDRLHCSEVDLLILDPTFVQHDVDFGNIDSLANFSNRYSHVSILFHTTVTDPQILEKMSHLDRLSVAHKADELQDVVQIVSRLLKGEVNVLSPRTHRLMYQARKLGERVPELYAF
ncbi:response regulator transcription factor [Caballeronia sp. M1242]|uniref:response regulator transcription factor n=1 Tax=Caballeronia sp. M1242 TaxID=2814653 RepID=UPI0019CF9FCE|nr:response regulator transcription factor [Caballeronia sp. M1242]QSN62529.1 response regulator transcription factor [Caballeronia sp. M1242]